MRRASIVAPTRAAERIEGPFVWTFDGTLADCLGDLEDTLRRAIVQVRDVASIVVLIELSLPALKRRVAAGERRRRAQMRVAPFRPLALAQHPSFQGHDQLR